MQGRNREAITLKQYSLALFAAWTFLLCLSFYFLNRYELDKIYTLVVGIARSTHNKDIAYRHWNAAHGGVFVPVTEDTPPNPYLDSPGKVVTTTDGRTLTLVNPAYMTRQVHELEKALYGVKGHITSLTPIRPANAPDAWEARALESFRDGATEVSGLADIDGAPYMRFMRAMTAEEPCLSCHARQGYKLGDIRGGISVSVPMAPFLDIHAQDMERHSLMLLGFWMLGSAGILYGRTFVSRQIERRAALHASAVEARLAAEAANRSKSEFLAVMSHEVRTPLSGLIGMLQLASDEAAGPRQSQWLSMALDCSHKLLAIINDILDLSRVEAGRFELFPSPVRPAEVANTVAGMFAQEARARGLSLTTDIDASARETVMADGGRLAQVLINLLGNAVKYTDQGSVNLEVFIAPTPDERRPLNLVFVVRDTGPGIPRQSLDAIFAPFTRLDKGRARARDGAGLGLAIAGRLTRQMGGEINVDSEPGQGCALYVNIPVLPAPAPRTGECVCVPADRLQAPGSVLLVEDERVNRLATTAILQKMGYAVTAVESGRAAVDAAREHRFDVILMDVRMPGMDGIEAMRIIRELPGRSGVRILAYTAQAMAGDKERCLKLGFDGYIPKPADKATLAEAMERAARAHTSGQ